MSKIKNTPEFQRMMDEQELSESFKYQEEELEKEQLSKMLAAEQAIRDATNEYLLASSKYQKALEAYEKWLETLKKVNDGSN